jgi:hypothetical protein
MKLAMKYKTSKNTKKVISVLLGGIIYFASCPPVAYGQSPATPRIVRVAKIAGYCELFNKLALYREKSGAEKDRTFINVFFLDETERLGIQYEQLEKTCLDVTMEYQRYMASMGN